MRRIVTPRPPGTKEFYKGPPRANSAAKTWVVLGTQRFAGPNQSGLTVAVAPVILPLQRLKVVQVISPTPVRRLLVPDFPAELAVRVSIALSPNERALRIDPQRRMVAAGRRSAPHRFNGCFVERLARCICIRTSEHVIARSNRCPGARERLLCRAGRGSPLGPK